jgi:hypothetical protein
MLGLPAGQALGRGPDQQPPRGQMPGGPGGPGNPAGPPPNNDGSGSAANPSAMPGQTTGAVPDSTTVDNTTSTPAAGTDQQQSPNGVRTPEQIFEEIRKRQQQTTPTQ